MPRHFGVWRTGIDAPEPTDPYQIVAADTEQQAAEVGCDRNWVRWGYPTEILVS
jgi:hypothetical protein